MVKKRKPAKQNKFKVGIIICFIFLIFVSLLYFAAREERHIFRDDELPPEQRLISYKELPLKYETEFCADKLGDIAYKLHFFEDDVVKETKLMETDGPILEKEEKAIQIEKQEVSELRDEFWRYKNLCDSFDEEPTSEICETFLEDAARQKNLAEKKLNNSKNILEKLKIRFKDLRKANRIYNGLQKICGGMK